MSTNGLSKRRRRVVTEALKILGDEFESVQVFVSHYDGKISGTFSHDEGLGNIYTREGQVKRWIEEPITSSDGDEDDDDDELPVHADGDC